VAAGRLHINECEIDLCSEWEGQRSSCDCEGHDPTTAVWNGNKTQGSVAESSDAAVNDLINRLGLDLYDDRVVRMVRYGLQSGFPPCCVAFFVLMWWRPAILLDRQSDELVTGDSSTTPEARANWKRDTFHCPACLLALMSCEFQTGVTAVVEKIKDEIAH
jgi:hypothetical protein